MKKFVLYFLITSIARLSSGQDTKLTNTLLWRISGNQLSKPSYLYGTMHLTDKRVFQLGDSVYKALEQTEGFAAELDMNRVGTQMVNQFIKEAEEKAAKEPVRVKDAVSAEVWNLYKEKLAIRFDKKADKITLDDLDAVETQLQTDLFRKGDMSTFLDAWLFGQARKQGKWVGGIEEIEDQLEHTSLDSDVEEKIQMALFDDDYYREGLESFIKTYTNQQLDSIDAFMYRAANGDKDYIMIKRNLKMARRMDSLSAIRSTLFAVGAAHLPGDSGVVALLRSRGFTVTPVISSRKVSADKYAPKIVSAQWFPVQTRDSGYFLQMPGVADGIEMFESMGIEMKMFFDISFMKMYMTLGIEMPEERKKIGADSIYNSLKYQYAKNGKVLSEKKITVNNVDGREYRFSSNEGEIKMQIFLPGMEWVIINGVFAFKEKTLTEPDTEKFFQSFIYNTNRPQKPTAEKVWTQMKFPLQSFSVEIPVNPKEAKDVVSEEGKTVYTWQAYDIQDQVFYGMRAALMKEGMYDAGDDTAYFINVKENLKASFENVKLSDSVFFSINNYPAYTVTLSGKAEGDFIETKMITVVRGGISYYLYALYIPTETGKNAAKRFLNSFRLLPYNQPEWKTVDSPDKSFTTVSPFPLTKVDNAEEDILPGVERFMLYDSLAAVTTYIDKTKLPDWYWFSSDTGFLRRRSDQYVTYGDSLADYKYFKTGNLTGAGFTVIKPGEHLVKKVQLVLNGDELFELYGHFAQQDMADMFNRPFNEFKIRNEKKWDGIGRSKMSDLTATLKGADKKKIEEIKLWWDNVEFTAADIPALQKLAFTIYPDFDTTYSRNLNSLIFQRIEALDSNKSTIDFIKTNYSSIQPKDEYVKPLVVSYLSGIKTITSFTILKESLLKNSFAVGNAPYYYHTLYDSLELTATLFPELMQVAGRESMWELVSGLTTSLLDDSLIEKSLIRQYSKPFIEATNRILVSDKKNIEEGLYNYADLIRILGIINSAETNNLLAKFAKFNNRGIRFQASIALLENNQPVDTKTIMTLATTDEFRHELYDQLKKMNKLKLFPTAYLTQKELGKSKLYSYATDEEAPSMITDAGTRTILYKGKQQKFYLYKVAFSEDEPVYYLGVAGPYPLNSKDLTSIHTITGVYWDKEFGDESIDKLFNEYMASIEAYEEESKEADPPPAEKENKK
ncbi:hypothetical protein CAP36_06205 [Chitinophagaceae bacterium IBVUCB2]|nr:hypothetical protein CAP36_06205 [Chitinophagaceae bacterium IBVUCB2]